MKSFLFLTLLSISTFSFAQEKEEPTEMPPPPRDPKAREKIEAARVGVITNKLGLTPEQAEKFWPVYREFAQKRQELRTDFRARQEKLDPANQDTEVQKKKLDLGLELKQKELDLEKDYSGRLLKVISTDQMLKLRGAERDFQRMLINQLQQRKNIQQRKETVRDRNQMLRQKKN